MHVADIFQAHAFAVSDFEPGQGVTRADDHDDTERRHDRVEADDAFLKINA